MRPANVRRALAGRLIAERYPEASVVRGGAKRSGPIRVADRETLDRFAAEVDAAVMGNCA